MALIENFNSRRPPFQTSSVQRKRKYRGVKIVRGRDLQVAISRVALLTVLMSHMPCPVVFPEKARNGMGTFWARTFVSEGKRRVLITAPEMAVEIFARGKADSVEFAAHFLALIWASMCLLMLARLFD
jgi:hypothetical protein